MRAVPKPSMIIVSPRKACIVMSAQSPHHMASNPRPVAGSINGCSRIERRGAVRVALPFPAIVRGREPTGDRYTLDTVLDNLSSTGLYLRLTQVVAPGASLFVVIRLAIAPAHQIAAPSVAVHGVVVWAELQPCDMCGIAVMFTDHRFLYAINI